MFYKDNGAISTRIDSQLMPHDLLPRLPTFLSPVGRKGEIEKLGGAVRATKSMPGERLAGLIGQRFALNAPEHYRSGPGAHLLGRGCWFWGCFTPPTVLQPVLAQPAQRAAMSPQGVRVDTAASPASTYII
jgi:hypothetical protein